MITTVVKFRYYNIVKDRIAKIEFEVLWNQNGQIEQGDFLCFLDKFSNLLDDVFKVWLQQKYFHTFHFEKSIKFALKIDKNFNAPNPSQINDKYYLNDLPN